MARASVSHSSSSSSSFTLNEKIQKAKKKKKKKKKKNIYAFRLKEGRWASTMQRSLNSKHKTQYNTMPPTKPTDRDRGNSLRLRGEGSFHFAFHS